MDHNNFALQDRQLFPLTNRAFTKVSACLFEEQRHKLPVREQLTAMRKIAAAAKDQGLDDGPTRDIAAACGDTLSPTFTEAMALRKRACADDQARSRVDVLARVGTKIAQEQKPETRIALLDSLCDEIVKFDGDAGIDHARGQVPAAIDTVFRKLADADDLLGETPLFEAHVVVGGRRVTATDLARFDAAAAKTLLVADTMAKAASLDAFATASVDEQLLIASFIP